MRTFLALVLALLLTHPLAAQLTPVGPSVNLPAAGCFSINADSFICRSIAGVFVVGTSTTGGNGVLRTGDGTVALPAWAFTLEPSSGWRRAGAGDVRLSVLGADVLRFASSVFLVTGENQVTSGNRLAFTNGGYTNVLTPISSGIIQLVNGAGTAGVTLDYSTDGVLNILNRAGTAATGTISVGGTILNGSVLFASLGTPANGTQVYCSDCQPTTPATCPATKSSCVCAGSGTGALAVRLNGVWDCGTFQ